MTSQSANEIDDDQVQDDAGEEEIGESALRTDVVEIRFVLRIALNSEARREDERTNAGDESREK